MAQVIQFPSVNVNCHSATVPTHRPVANVQHASILHSSPTTRLTSRGLPKSRVSQFDSPWQQSRLTNPSAAAVKASSPTAPLPTPRQLTSRIPCRSGRGSLTCPTRRYLSGPALVGCSTPPRTGSPVVRQSVLQVNPSSTLAEDRIAHSDKFTSCIGGGRKGPTSSPPVSHRVESAAAENLEADIMKLRTLSHQIQLACQPPSKSVSTVGDKSGQSGTTEAASLVEKWQSLVDKPGQSALLSECSVATMPQTPLASCDQGEKQWSHSLKVSLTQLRHDLSEGIYESPTFRGPTIEETPESLPFASVFEKDENKVEEYKWYSMHSESTAAASPEVVPATPGSPITSCTLSEQDSVETFPKPASDKPSSSHSYTSEQWKAYQELEQVEMTSEFRRLEIRLAEERSHTAQLQKVFAIELMAQKDAHTRDVHALEEMVGKVLTENKRLSGMVEHLCGKVQHGTKAWETPCVAEGIDQSEKAETAIAFLPSYVNGACILVEEKKNVWRVTNSQLKADTKGVGYRKHKDSSERFGDSVFAQWEDLIDGFDEGDGWIRCQVAVKGETSVPHKAAILHSKGTSEADASTESEHHVSSSSDDTLGGMKLLAWPPHSGMETSTFQAYTNVD